MKKLSNASMINIFLNEPLNYERMLEIPTEELEFLKDECDSVMKDLKLEIIKQYDSIKGVLDKMRDLKLQLRKLKERREIYKTFISIDKNQSILSDSSFNSNTAEIKHVSLSQLFKDIEDDKLIDDTVANPIFINANSKPGSKPISVLNKVIVPEAKKTKPVLSRQNSKLTIEPKVNSNIKPKTSGLITPKIYKK